MDRRSSQTRSDWDHASVTLERVATEIARCDLQAAPNGGSEQAISRMHSPSPNEQRRRASAIVEESEYSNLTPSNPWSSATVEGHRRREHHDPQSIMSVSAAAHQETNATAHGELCVFTVQPVAVQQPLLMPIVQLGTSVFDQISTWCRFRRRDWILKQIFCPSSLPVLADNQGCKISRRLISGMCNKIQDSPRLLPVEEETRFLELGSLLGFDDDDVLAFLGCCRPERRSRHLADPLYCMLYVWQAIFRRERGEEPEQYLYNAMCVAGLEELAKCISDILDTNPARP